MHFAFQIPVLGGGGSCSVLLLWVLGPHELHFHKVEVSP